MQAAAAPFGGTTRSSSSNGGEWVRVWMDRWSSGKWWYWQCDARDHTHCPGGMRREEDGGREGEGRAEREE
jgi:hypothetical protein